MLDAGRRVDWEALSWTHESPAGTVVFLDARTGDTPTPDGTWTSFAPVAVSGDPVGGSSRYVQYRADLMSSDPARTPALDGVSVSYTDTTAPAVAIDAVSDALVGPTDTGTDVTWHADEDGTYSVRVGGADCATGDEVESGSYAGARSGHGDREREPARRRARTRSGSAWPTRRATQARETTSVVKDTTAPTVTVDSVSDTLIGPSDTGTDVTWHADENGAYSVRVGASGMAGRGKHRLHDRNGGRKRQLYRGARAGHDHGERERPARDTQPDPGLRHRCRRQPRLADGLRGEGPDRAHRDGRLGLRHR